MQLTSQFLAGEHAVQGLGKRRATRRSAGHVTRAAAPPPAWPGRAPVPESIKKPDGPKAPPLPSAYSRMLSANGGRKPCALAAAAMGEKRVLALAAGGNLDLLAEQVKQFQPELVSIRDPGQVPTLREALVGAPRQPEIVTGEAGICAVAAHPGTDACVTGIVGCAGLHPTVAAIEAGKDICLANKETLIAGGPFVLPLAKRHGVHILPADSEHSAIFQCLQGLPEGGMQRIILTASGGAFRDWPVERLPSVTVADALKHPNWSMGKKITVDSATLMNKGLEVIEAHYLFGASYDDIEIVIHPQSIIHSMASRAPRVAALASARGVQPDHAKYPSMALAYASGRAGGTMTGVMSAANEQAVELFLEERIGYLDIMRVVEAACDAHRPEMVEAPSLEEIVHYDGWARRFVADLVARESGVAAVAA
eukprot:scaffold8.g1504.t1